MFIIIIIIIIILFFKINDVSGYFSWPMLVIIVKNEK